MKASAKYAKIVEWSEEDQCYVGSAPGLTLAGCHGDDEKQVFDELCQIVEEAIELYRTDGKPLHLQPLDVTLLQRCKTLPENARECDVVSIGNTLHQMQDRESN